MTPLLRMPAEWEPHRATWIAWPHHEPDWPGKLGADPLGLRGNRPRAEPRTNRSRFSAVRRIRRTRAPGARRPTGSLGAHAHHRAHRSCLAARLGADRRHRRSRAASPSSTGASTRWAKYDNWQLDDELAPRSPRSPACRAGARSGGDGSGLVLEGGGIESTARPLLTTEEWLLSDVQVRNPG